MVTENSKIDGFADTVATGWTMRSRLLSPSSRIYRTLLILAVSSLIAVAQRAQGPVYSGTIENAIQTQHFPLALQLIDTALRGQPRDCYLWTLRGRALSMLKRQSEGLESYRRAIALQPHYLPAIEGVAEIQYSRDDPHAVETLSQVLRLDPNNQAAHAMLGELAYERHNCEEAVAHFDRASGQLNEKREALVHFGACLFDLKRPAGAAEVFQRALALDRTDKSLQFDLGLSLLEAKRPIEAIDVLRPLADEPIPESDVLSLLAESYESVQQTQNAIEVLRRAAGLYPQDPQHYQLLAALCIKHDAYDLAGEVLDAGIAKVPDSADLQTMRGLLFMLVGQTERAEESFDRATRLAPEESWGRLGSGIALFSSGQLAESMQVLRKQLARDPNDPQANYFLARVLLHQSDDPGTSEFEEAKIHLHKALVAAPDFTQALFLEAKSYLKLHRDADAIVDLQRAVALDPTFGSAIYQLSRAYARTGRTAEAASLNDRIHTLLVSERTHQTVHLARTGDGTSQQ